MRKSEPTSVLRVAAYCRVSTKQDMQDGSFENQMEYYKKYIMQQPGYILAGLYGDHGKSGRTMKKRPELKRLLEDCTKGKIDLILTKSISRFARNLSECLDTIRTLKTLNVAVYFERENLNTKDERNELFLSILAAIAQEESVSMGQNMRWARKKRYEIGQPSEIASYGYRSVGKEHQWIVEESQARRVKTAFYLAGTGKKYPDIRNALNQLEEAEETGKVWNHTPVVNLLTNLAYIGDFLTNKECSIATEYGVKRCRNKGYIDQFYIEGHHEPLVSRELFEGVGELIGRHLLFAHKKSCTKDDLQLLEYCRKLAEEELAQAFRGRHYETEENINGRYSNL